MSAPPRSASNANGAEPSKRPSTAAGSSVLFNKANLAWSQPTGAFLAAPAPPIPAPQPPKVEPPESLLTAPVTTGSVPPVTLYSALPVSSAAPVNQATHFPASTTATQPVYTPASEYSTPYASPTQPLPPPPTSQSSGAIPLPVSNDYGQTAAAYQYPANYYPTPEGQGYSSYYQQQSADPQMTTAAAETDFTKAFQPLVESYQNPGQQQGADQAAGHWWTSFYNAHTTHAEASYQPAYEPVQCHWFFEKNIEGNIMFKPFTMKDSARLEAAYQSQRETIVAVEGGRYDVDVNQRLRRAVYWDEQPSQVRRSTWFYYREGQTRPDPYDEQFAHYLEQKYHEALMTGKWNQKVGLGNGNHNEYIVFYNTQTMMHFSYQPSAEDPWTGETENPMKGQVVRRGPQDFEADVDKGEPEQIDHLIFMVHGVGPMCDFRMRSIVEVVDDLRSLSLRLVLQHFKNDQGTTGRIEYLPVSWHTALHGDETGIDERLESITLTSIPKLRAFSNDTILDALFYTSPVYSQTIIDAVAGEINRIHSLFLSRNQSFTGKVSLAGHSLGSLIIFDILSHQSGDNCANLQPDPLSNMISNMSLTKKLTEAANIDELCQMLEITQLLPKLHQERIDLESFWTLTENDFNELSLPLGIRKKIISAQKSLHKSSASTSPDSVNLFPYYTPPKGTGQPNVHYPKLNFNTSCFFALGSPIAMFLTVRGIKALEQDFTLPCQTFLNIFHPFDPIAYRVEPMINPTFAEHKPVLVPHHKGRKRMHLEIKENLADFKQKVFDSLKTAWGSISDRVYARGSRPAATYSAVTSPQTEKDINAEVEKVVNAELERDQAEPEFSQEPDQVDLPIGKLNSGRRIDYVLQERPYEVFNEYLFAIAAHACYWESEDTALLLIKEMYSSQGIQPTSNTVVNKVEKN